MKMDLLHFKPDFFDSPIIIVLLVFSSLLFLFKRSSTRNANLNLPPSPPTLPLIGNIHQLHTSFHRCLKSLSEEYGPVMTVYLASVPHIIVSSADLAKEIMKTHDTVFAGRPGLKAADVFFYGCTDIAFSPYNEYWRRVKKICVLEFLSFRKVQSFRSVREDVVSEAVERIRSCCGNGSSIDLGKMMITISSNIVTRSVLGEDKNVEEHESESFGESLRKVMDLLGAFSFEDLCPWFGWMDNLTGLNSKLKETSEKLHRYIDKVIDEHLSRTSDENDHVDKKDFVDILLHHQKHGASGIDLTRDNIKALLLDMFVGGTDTAASAMEWAMAELAKNPSTMKKTQEEVRRVVGNKLKVDESDINKMPFLKCVIKETLRLHTVFLIARESSTDVTLAGYNFPANSKVVINSWGIHRCPKTWDRPEEFVPERFLDKSIDFIGNDSQFIPFGSGRRACPGISYAVIEMEYVIASLLCWFDWGFADGKSYEELDMADVFQQVIRKKIPLTLVPMLHTH